MGPIDPRLTMDATTTNLHYLELMELAARIRAREVSPWR